MEQRVNTEVDSRSLMQMVIIQCTFILWDDFDTFSSPASRRILIVVLSLALSISLVSVCHLLTRQASPKENILVEDENYYNIFDPESQHIPYR